MYRQFAKDVVTDGVRGLEENVPFGILAGAIAAVIGAATWMQMAITAGLHVEYAAPLGVGLLVGLAVREVGHGTSLIFGIIGAVLTLIGCLGGEILTIVQLSTTPHHDFYNVLTTVDLTQVVTRILDKSDLIVYVVSALGIFVAYRLSIRK